MELARMKACICEGAAEAAIIDVLMDNDLLIFKREEILEESVIRCRDGKNNEDKYSEFKKSGKKPSAFCKENLKIANVKAYEFVKVYFADPRILVQAIKKYNEISKIRKGEYTLSDLLK